MRNELETERALRRGRKAPPRKQKRSSANAPSEIGDNEAERQMDQHQERSEHRKRRGTWSHDERRYLLKLSGGKDTVIKRFDNEQNTVLAKAQRPRPGSSCDKMRYTSGGSRSTGVL